MGENSAIEWTDHTFNPWIGCAKVAAGCTNCYAETLMDTRYGRVEWGANGTRSRTSAGNWAKVRKWNREALDILGRKARVFCASLADVGEDRDELIPWRADLCELIRECDSLDLLLLTKRPENMARLFPHDVLERCWVGYSVAEHKDGDKVEALLNTPAALHFLSIEPLLESVLGAPSGVALFIDSKAPPSRKIKSWRPGWVIVGCESGKAPRGWQAYEPNAHGLLANCQRQGVPVFHKQMPVNGGVGHDLNQWPQWARVRQFPLLAD